MSSVVVFSGGRGSSTISKAALNTPGVKLSVLVNGYDDGLSTGVIRRLFPGSLGPSDFRKVISGLNLDRGTTGGAISRLLEFRSSPSDVSKIQSGKVASDIDGLREICFDLSLRVVKEVNDSLTASLLLPQCMDVNPKNWEGMAIGNLIIAGLFAQINSDFNHAINRFNKIFLPEVNLQNVTNGENLVLVALKANGDFLHDEAAIVGAQNDSPLLDIYLLRDYFAPNELPKFQSLSLTEKKSTLEKNEVFPESNSEAISAIQSADSIIYGPGTQHSSLFPSYLTRGLAEAIRDNSLASKILVTNIGVDHDLIGENITSIFRKFSYYMGLKDKKAFTSNSLVTNLLVQTDGPLLNRTDWQFARNFVDATRDSGVHVALHDWSGTEERHHGERIISAALASSKGSVEATNLRHVSIIVPVLNEVSRCGPVLDSLVEFDWLSNGYLPELIVVDGGSSDGSQNEVEAKLGVTVLRSEKLIGLGEALRKGIEFCKADLIITFPSDGEYNVIDLVPALKMLEQGRAQLVLGSRSGFCADNRENLRKVYAGKPYIRIMSRMGGLALTVAILLRHRRTVSDPLSSIKGFHRDQLTNLSLKGKGVNWHIRFIRDAALEGIAITELPVSYFPRHRSEGKKTGLIDGLSALVEAIR